MSDRQAPAPPIFVDLESSGLLPGSYPLEVGWAKPVALPPGRGCAIELGSVLVRPEPEWLAAGGWDRNADVLHGLHRETLLRDGLPAAEVCALLDREFGGRMVVTDTSGGSADEVWLAALYEAAGRRPAGWEVAQPTADQLLLTACRAHGLRVALVMAALHWRAPQPTHAAAEDALCHAWRHAMVQQIGRFRVGELDEAGQRAALRDLGRTVPPDCWPRIDAAGRGFRTRR
jgi:hypothetical protein